ncbi:MAG: tRNA lysidine(34) synthetase TilS [Flavobacteriales bacterium]
MSNPILSGIQSLFNECGVHTNDTLIVGVSGGVDSMVLLHACKELNMHVVVAHVNYGFRGEESRADEEFVRNFCAQHSIHCEIHPVNQQEREEHEGSTQEWARRIRYDWFQELMLTYHARFTLVAHHANDQTETMLLQFIRGGAGKSVYGMAQRNGSVLRPLLPFTKTTILEYAQANNIAWRSDSSNDTDAYTRNIVRHRLLPAIEEINPHIHDTIQQRSAIMHEEQTLIDNTVRQFLDEHLSIKEGLQSLSIASLRKSHAERVVLWRWLNPLGFTSGHVFQIAEMCDDVERTEAAHYSSETHNLFIQRGMISCVTHAVADEIITIEELPASASGATFQLCTTEDVAFTSDNVRQYLDADKLEFPLRVRSRQSGDRFRPLGAPGTQTVADFLTHAHIPAWEKERTRVLESNGKVLAVLGLRIDDAYKITAATRRCVCITFSGPQPH